MKRLLAVFMVGMFLGVTSGVFAATQPDDFGFVKLLVTKVGKPLASYPVSIKQVIPAKIAPDGATHTIHLRRTTNKNGRCSFGDRIHLRRPFVLEVGEANNDDMEYFVTRRQIQGGKDSEATDMLCHVNFPADAQFTMTKLGEGDLCRLTCVLKSCTVKGLVFCLTYKVGDATVRVTDKGNNIFDFDVPAPDKDDKDPIDYTLVLKKDNKVYRKFQFTVKPGEVRKDLTIDFGQNKDASE